MAVKRVNVRTRTKTVRSADTASLPLFASAMRKAHPAASSVGIVERPSHISTGLPTLDRAMLGGFPVGATSLVAARHQVGATSLLIGSALAALKLRLPVAYFTERLREEQLRGRFVVLESRVNGHRIRAGFMSAEDRVALAAARERIGWNLLSITSKQKLSPRSIEANIFSYRPALVLADIRPRPPTPDDSASALDALLEGIACLAAIAHEQQVALVVRMILPKGNHVPDVMELPGLGAAVLPFGAAVFLHRERLVDEADDESTGASHAEARVIRLRGAEIEPRVIPLRFDQRFAGLLEA